MAADIIKIQDHSRGIVKETTIFNPTSNILWVESNTGTLEILVGLLWYSDNFGLLQVKFSSRDLADAFVQGITDALRSGGTGTVVLSNLGPVSTTTTTTEEPV